MRPSREGAGKTGCALHPRSRVQNAHSKNAHEHTGSAEAVRPSLRNGFTACNALSPVIELVCHRCQRDAKHHRHVTPASGVRTTRLRRPHQRRSSTRQKRATTLSRPPHPTPNVRDDRDTPLIGRGTAGNTQVICAARKPKNFCEQGWTGESQNCPTGKSARSADARVAHLWTSERYDQIEAAR
jgi:hypothetical protein